MLQLGHLDKDTSNFIRKIFDAAGRGLLLVDRTGYPVLLNRLADKWLAVPEKTLLSQSLPPLWELIEPVIDARQASSEAPLLLGKREVLVQINPLVQGENRTGAVCMLVESRLVESMSRRLPSLTALSRELDAIINSSSDGLFVCDGQANVIRMNPASEKIHQVRSKEIVGRNMGDLIEAGFIDRSAALETSRSGKKVSLLQDKAGRRLMSIATPVHNEAGQLERIVVSERDISEIDRLQREIEEQEAKADIFRNQILEQQKAALEARRVIARSPAMVRVLEQAVKVSSADSSVLILGESGVGKGLIADLIHQHSLRRNSPLIKINCGAIPESLIEAELFGYEKGAFTGAHDKGKPGQFELADGGILFLDEIAELPLASQVKLLRFLEDGQITRLGGTSSRKADVRILAATHRDLKEMVGQGKFRLDLYYRLNVIPLKVPSLRERGECLVPLLRHYIEQFSQQVGHKKRLTRAALDVLTHYEYPGNVRELMNLCERLVVMTETEMIGLPDLPAELVGGVQQPSAQKIHWRSGQTLSEALADVEKQLLGEAKSRFRNQTEMAEALGINQSTIARKLRKYGIG